MVVVGWGGVAARFGEAGSSRRSCAGRGVLGSADVARCVSVSCRTVEIAAAVFRVASRPSVGRQTGGSQSVLVRPLVVARAQPAFGRGLEPGTRPCASARATGRVVGSWRAARQIAALGGGVGAPSSLGDGAVPSDSRSVILSASGTAGEAVLSGRGQVGVAALVGASIRVVGGRAGEAVASGEP